MNQKVLKKSETLFIDCNGSYLLSAYSFFLNENNINDFLLYLADCEFVYENKYNDIKNVEDKNPWQFQPLKIINSEKQALFENNALLHFINFLKESFNLKINIIYKSNKEDFLKDYIIKSFNKEKLIIVNIDEYYISNNLSYYKKIHNSHGFLIKELNLMENLVTVIDSESEKNHTVKFDELAQAFNSDFYINYIISINGNDLVNNINYKQTLNSFLNKNRGFSFIQNIIDDLETLFIKKKISNTEKKFHLKRFHFSFLFKIISYVKMRNHLLSIMKLLPDNFKDTARLWHQLANTMLMEIYSENYSIDQIINILLELKKNEEEIYSNIKILLNKV